MIRPQLIVLTSDFIYLNQAPIELIVLVVRKGGAGDDQSIELRNSLLILDQEWSPSSLVSTVCGPAVEMILLIGEQDPVK